MTSVRDILIQFWSCREYLPLCFRQPPTPISLPSDQHPRPSACAGLCPLIVITGFCPHRLQSLLKQHLLNKAYPDPSLNLQPLSLITLNSLLPCRTFSFSVPFLWQLSLSSVCYDSLIHLAYRHRPLCPLEGICMSTGRLGLITHAPVYLEECLMRNRCLANLS